MARDRSFRPAPRRLVYEVDNRQQQLQGLRQLKAQMEQFFTRTELAASQYGRTKNGERDLQHVLGYLKQPTYENFFFRYQRVGIARRAVNLPVLSAWDRNVTMESRGTQKGSTCECHIAFQELNDRLGLVSKLLRLDRFCAFGKYACLLLGFNDPDLSQPISENKKADDLLYVQPYASRDIKIDKWNEDPTSPRFLSPETYKLEVKMQDGRPALNKKVHWSRIIHVADDTVANDYIGTPRMMAYVDHVDDIVKICGGSAEMFWQGADRMFNVVADAEAVMPDDMLENMRAEVDKMYNGLSRIFAAQGAELKAIPSVTPDPRGPFDTQIALISAATGIPSRILVGSEQAELASSQDRENFAETVGERRMNFCEPYVLRPFIDRMIEIGVLPRTKDDKGYVVNWPAPLGTSAKQVAEIGMKRAQSIKFLADSAGLAPVSEGEMREAIGLPREMDSNEPFITLNEQDPEVQSQFADLTGRKMLPELKKQ